MEETVAFVMSWYVFVLGLSFLLQARHWSSWIREAAESPHELHLMLIYALIFLAGLAVIAAHNIWIMDWPVVITVFGWGMAIKGGAILVLAPKFTWVAAQWPANAAVAIRAAGFVWTVLGAILVYQNGIAR